MKGEAFSPETTMVVILGASSFPKANLPDSKAFRNAADSFVTYLTDKTLFSLPNDPTDPLSRDLHLFNRFDFDGSPLELNTQLTEWLRLSQSTAETMHSKMRDLIVYYVGHGGFTSGGEQAYFLALRCTVKDDEGISSLRMTDLARTIRREAKDLRRFLILDCCFAESAYTIFQADGDGPAGAAHSKARQDLPQKGTALLCSSSSRDVSISRQNTTMFSEALLAVLRSGDPRIKAPLSLEQVGNKVTTLILDKYADDGVRPKVSTPDEQEGDIADLPIFPNPAIVSPLPDRRFLRLEEQVDQIGKAIRSFEKVSFSLAQLEVKVEELSASPATTIFTEAVAEQTSYAEILRTAPMLVQSKVRQYREAKAAGMLWVGFGIGSAVYLGWVSLHYKVDFHSWYVAVNALVAIWSIFRGIRHRSSNEQEQPPIDDPTMAWTRLPIVLDTFSHDEVSIFGRLCIASPLFEIGTAIFVLVSLYLFFKMIFTLPLFILSK